MDENRKDKQIEEYSVKDISVLEGLEPVRIRPGMYIGDTAVTGLHHLVWEIIDNAIDEGFAGGCDLINITIFPDNSVQVEDNGRGIPTGMHPQTHVSTVETVFRNLHAGAKFGRGGYKTSGGLHGVGAAAVNALSTSFEVWSRFGGENCYVKFVNGGETVAPLKSLGKTDLHGTIIKFHPDPTIFKETIEFNYETIRDRVRQLAFLNRAMTINIEDKRTNVKESFHYEGGLKEYVKFINAGRDIVCNDIFYVEGTGTDAQGMPITVEVAFQHNRGYATTLYTYCNNIFTPGGGTHEDGFRGALGRTFNKYALYRKVLKEGEETISADDIKEGLVAIVSVRINNPQFEGQTKHKLGNSEVRTAVNRVVSDGLNRFLMENPNEGMQILDKLMLARKGRIEAHKAREITRKGALSFSALPGKLADCSSRDASKSEIFIVEGDSAGGSAKSGRSREFQAILPLRGKIINVQKNSREKVLSNQEIETMITAFGTSIGSEFDISKLRYHKIIIMTDADVDGAHIATLLLTFFYNFMRPLIEQGHVYIAQPPLYKVSQGKYLKYAYKEEEMDDIRRELNPNQKVSIQRYKGLGEMDASQLWETTMDPNTRILKQVHLDDIVAADAAFDMLMGEKVQPRKEYIMANAKFVKNLDI